MKAPGNHVLITCILPRGKAQPVLCALKDEKNIITANIKRARGAGRMTPMAYRGVGETTEKDIMVVIINEEKADEIFEFIFDRAEINRPHGGIMFQQKLSAATAFSLPDLPYEE
ncbi:MAG: hypothetical protein EP297_09670 [Gammaproteobacteria bacterium]|nr:MAG: hypothetical protein EP297_09670 [Gammaproteobacteria bacterium]